MGEMTSQITSLTIVYSTIYSGADQRKNIKVPRHWPLCGEFTSDRWIHKGPETQKMFPFDDVIMSLEILKMPQGIDDIHISFEYEICNIDYCDSMTETCEDL